jgi:hypothetical protein
MRLLPALWQAIRAERSKLAQAERAFVDANLDHFADAAIGTGIEG